MTYDIDIMIEANINRLLKQLSDWGYKPRALVDPGDPTDPDQRGEWVETKDMKAFSFYHDQFAIAEIDIVIHSPIPYKDLKRNAVNINLSGIDVPTVGIEDLITMKSSSSRKQDLADVENLKKLLAPTLPTSVSYSSAVASSISRRLAFNSTDSINSMPRTMSHAHLRNP